MSSPHASLAATLAVVLAATLVGGCASAPPAADTRVDVTRERALAVHRSLLTLDTHLDTPLVLMRPGFDFGKRHDGVRSFTQVDLPRLEEGGLDAGFYAVFVSQRERTPAGFAQAADLADRTFARIEATIARHPERLAKATTAAATRRIVDGGRHAVLIGVENGHALGNDIERVALYRQRGMRYLGLVHFDNNELGDASTDARGPEHGGLSAFGREVVAELNRCGVMVDVSHASDDVVRQAIALSKTPVIASHSGARAVFDHPRNLPDELVRAIAASGGVIQVNGMSEYLRRLEESPERRAALAELRAGFPPLRGMSEEQRLRFWLAIGEVNARFPPARATVSDVADHVEHLVRVAGIDHVGIGLDFDGGGGVDGIADVSEIPNLTLELMRRGFTPAQLRRIWGANLLRVLRATEQHESRVARSEPCGLRNRAVMPGEARP